VEVLLGSRLPEEGHLLRNIVNQLAAGEGEREAQPLRQSLLDEQRERVIKRIALRLAERAHTGVLRKRPQQLRQLHGGQAETRGRIGDDANERIRHLVRGVVEQLVPQGEIGTRQLVVRHAALAIRQVLSLAAQVSCFYNP